MIEVQIAYARRGRIMFFSAVLAAGIGMAILQFLCAFLIVWLLRTICRFFNNSLFSKSVPKPTTVIFLMALIISILFSTFRFVQFFIGNRAGWTL
jgi:hypothetical protein